MTDIPSPVAFDIARVPPLVGQRLQRMAAEQPDKPLYTYLPFGDRPPLSLTRSETWERACALAGMLASRDLRQRPVVLVYEAGPEFVLAFLGTLLAGAIAVPVPVPQFAAQFDRFSRILADCEPGAILSTSDIQAKILAKEPPLRSCAWLATDTEPAAQPFQPMPVSPSDVAVLQYTSGSTSEPKGVTLTHANIAHNLEMIAEVLRLGEEDRFVSWLPHFHDLGLVMGIFSPMIRGGDSILMSPRMFLLRPLRWLQAISDYRAQVSGAPNFAFELCVRSINRGDHAELDLSCWRSAFTGAEPIRMATLEAFADRFRSAGFARSALTPSYGMAEATVLVTCKPFGEPPNTYRLAREPARRGQVEPSRHGDALVLTGCGHPPTDTLIRIVDPELSVTLPPGRIGEVWVAGPQVARGYWNRQGDYNPFGTRLAESGREAEGNDWLRTGDLGFLTEAGELVFVDRLKDIIIVNGQNHACHDLELTSAESHALLSADNCVAIDLDTGARTHLALIAELPANALESAGQIASAIRSSLFTTHSLSVQTIAFVPPRKLSRTTSGKLQRRLTAQRLSDGTLRPLAHYGDPLPTPALPTDASLVSGDDRSS